jgi:prevent-host-death family protein
MTLYATGVRNAELTHLKISDVDSRQMVGIPSAQDGNCMVSVSDYNDHNDYLDLERFAMSSQSWTVAEAKAKFSEIIERAMSEGPQTITRNGHTAAVVVGAEEWQRKTKRVGNLAEFFAESPLRESSLKIHRLKERPRKISL